MKQSRRTRAHRLAVLLGVALIALPGFAQGRVVVRLFESGGDVIGLCAGSANLEGLEFRSAFDGCGAEVIPWLGHVVVGGNGDPFCLFASADFGSITGPNSFGPGTVEHNPDVTSGDSVGVSFGGDNIRVPDPYQSGAPLSGMSVWKNQTLGSLGLTPGRYLYRWGSGANVDSLEILIGIRVAARAPTVQVGSGPTGVVASWASAPGALYQVQQSTDLRRWTDVGTPLIGTGATLEYLIPRTGPSTFIRVVVP